jgi:hypothetical protein
MPDDHPQSWMPGERSGGGQPQRGETGLGVPSPGVGRERGGRRGGQPAEVRRAHRGGRRRGVQVQRHVERLERRQQWRVPWVIEERAVQPDCAVHKTADEAERLHAAG